MKEYEPLFVTGPDGVLYKIPAPAKDDWDSWLDLAGDKWTAPLYAKVASVHDWDVVT